MQYEQDRLDMFTSETHLLQSLTLQDDLIQDTPCWHRRAREKEFLSQIVKSRSLQWSQDQHQEAGHCNVLLITFHFVIIYIFKVLKST